MLIFYFFKKYFTLHRSSTFRSSFTRRLQVSNPNQKPGQSQQPNQDHQRQGQQQQESGGRQGNPNNRDQRPAEQPKRDQKPGAGKNK